MIGAAVAIAMMGLCTLVFAVTRATAVRRTFVTSRRKAIEDLSLLHAVARRQRARAAMSAIACAATGMGVAMLPIDAASRIAFAVTPALLFAVAAVSTWQLHALVRLVPDATLRVVSHGQYLYASRNKTLLGWVAAPPQILSSTLPRATLHKPGSCARGAAWMSATTAK